MTPLVNSEYAPTREYWRRKNGYSEEVVTDPRNVQDIPGLERHWFRVSGRVVQYLGPDTET